MQIHKFFTSKTFHIVTWVVAGLIILGFVFSAGIHVGIKKASHSFERRGKAPQFMAPNMNPDCMRGPSPFMEKGELGETNGVTGIISAIEGNTITVKDRNDENRIVLVDEKTQIKKMRDLINVNMLSIDDIVTVLGESVDSEHITAKLIRVMPRIEKFNP